MTTSTPPNPAATDSQVTDPRFLLISGLAGTRWAGHLATLANNHHRTAVKMVAGAIRDIERREGALPAVQRQILQEGLTLRFLSVLQSAAQLTREAADKELMQVPEIASALRERQAHGR